MKFSSKMGHFLKGKKSYQNSLKFWEREKKMIRFDENFVCYYFFLFVLCHMNQQRLISYALVNTIIFTWKHFQKWHTVIKVSKSYLENISFKPTKKLIFLWLFFPPQRLFSIFLKDKKMCCISLLLRQRLFVEKFYFSINLTKKRFHKKLLWNIPCVYTLWIGKKMWNTVIRNIFIQNFLWISIIEFCFAANCLQDDFLTFLERSWENVFAQALIFGIYLVLLEYHVSNQFLLHWILKQQ